MRRSSEPVWPHRSDFVDCACAVPRPSLGEELALSNAMLSDYRSASSIARLLEESQCSECPPPESGVFLTEEDVEYFWTAGGETCRHTSTVGR